MNCNKELLFSRPCWAWHPDRAEHEAGYTLFRKTVYLTGNAQFHLALSADNRYTFYLDGKVMGRGPLRGDLSNYFYEEYQGKLSPGKHIFAVEVVVWSEAWRWSAAPWAEMHAGGGLMTAGYVGNERMELPEGWLCSVDYGRRPSPWKENWKGSARIPAPPMDRIDFSLHCFDWYSSEYPEGEWINPAVLGNAEFKNTYQTDPDTPWNLTKRTLKPMAEYFLPVAKILAGPENISLIDGRLKGNISAGKTIVLLDLGRNQTFMVKFSGDGGKGFCRMAYSETLFDDQKHKVHNYPGTVGEYGYADLLHFSGDPWRYDSFWYRTGRFIELELELTEPLTEILLELAFITYPLGPYREFHAPDDPVLEKIYQTACHTLSCCSHEHFEDCPYYEQLQYAGDSRGEALVSYAVSGKDDLGRHALRSIAASQFSGGLTQSRYPSVFKQVIPGYSLIWALMLHDHYVFFNDADIVRELLPNVAAMLDAFERVRLPDGLIGSLPGWHYTDWVSDWPSGCSDRGENVPETILNLFYAEACKRTAELAWETGGQELAAQLRQRAERTIDAVNALCFDSASNRYMDAPGHPDWLSLHANTLAVLTGAVPEEKRAGFLREICADTRLKQMTLYFSFYLLSAIMKYGTPEELRAHYAPWEEMLACGSTTFPEKPGPCRSECHAWSCAPAYFLLRSSGALKLDTLFSLNI
ncbi:MAG: hypothetical protein E7044_11575 [Lentisphaerae bacterium]|nr:hypothetical protein [Lentisphaerota bacterium]